MESAARLPARFLPLAMLAIAALILFVGCDRPEPPPDERPAGSRAAPPGGAIPPPDAPAELARPLPLPAPPEARPTEPPAAEKEPASKTVAEVPPAGAPEKEAVAERRPEAAPPAEPSPFPPPPATAENTLPAVSRGTGLSVAAPPERTDKELQPARGADRAPPDRKAGREKTARKQTPATSAGAPQEAAAREIPIWARGGEELSYKITFMGVTAGYARLLSKGKVRIGGRDAYHILIKAWTTGTLAALFPISESFDYYLDAETLAPIRRDSWLKKVNRPEIVLFDQEKGTITHWYGDTMEVRKKKEIPPPTFYDGVSATYYFRSRGIGDRNVSIRVFGGRKVYRVSSERAGEESIAYGNGKVDTFLVKPLYREEGGSGEKPMIGELLVWVSKDPRRVPVKLYAAFRKGLEWRLVGELQSGLPGP